MPDRVIEGTEVCLCGNVVDAANSDYPGVCPKCGKIS